MTQIVKHTIKTEAVFSEDRNHRLLLKKVWNSKQPLVTVITKYPNLDGDIKSDLTTMLITNNVYEQSFGQLCLVNLFSNVNINKGIDEVEDLVHEETDKYITQAAESSDTVILAWGSTNSKNFTERIKEVNQLLEEYKDKLRVLVNPDSKEICHPLNPKSRNFWMVEKLAIRTDDKNKKAGVK